MPEDKKGRPKATRQFKWFEKEGDYGLWMENVDYDPENKQKAPRWEDATKAPSGEEKGCGKPLPAGEDWGVPPDPNKFLRIWVRCSSIEEAFKQMWWCSPARLRRERSEISQYLEAKGFKKIRVLRSRKHMFGNTGAQANRAMKRLIEDGIIEYLPKAERERLEKEKKAKIIKSGVAGTNKVIDQMKNG